MGKSRTSAVSVPVVSGGRIDSHADPAAANTTGQGIEGDVVSEVVARLQ